MMLPQKGLLLVSYLISKEMEKCGVQSQGLQLDFNSSFSPQNLRQNNVKHDKLFFEEVEGLKDGNHQNM